MQKRYVAIIGGGIGGLSAAYFLQGQRTPDGKAEYACEIFEKEKRLGGNALTAYLRGPLQGRFADLAVNDFNLTTYKIMGEILAALRSAHLEVPNQPLNDSACFFTVRGETGAPVAITTEELGYPTTETTRRIAQDIVKFRDLAEKVLHDDDYAGMSVGGFLAKHGFTPEFANLYMLPRINGMYFMGETVPEDMPIRGVMSYYHLQEGVGAKEPPNRRYFVDGSSQWIAQLAEHLRRMGVVFHLGDAPQVIAREGGAKPHVLSKATDRLEWDAVIVAVPADQVTGVVIQGLPPLMPTLLNEFRYINSIAIAHTYEEVMPPRREDWRTYNIRIFPAGSRLLRPYTISYVETMHQGAKTPAPPTWFVSENPPVPIPDDRILEMTDPVTGQPTKAVWYFRHNTITLGSIGAQKFLPALQGQNGLFFAGGWTRGAGLHEEILFSSREIAYKMRGIIQRELLYSF